MRARIPLVHETFLPWCRFCAIVAVFSTVPQSGALARPLGLKDAFSHAVQYDAQLHGAEADRKIAREEVSKAFSAFMPTIRATTSKGRSRTESWTSYQPYNKQYYNTLSNALSLKQPILNVASFAALKQAKLIQAKSESMLAYEQSNLIVRTAEAYFNLLYAEDNLQFTRAQRSAAMEQLHQARRRYEGGFGTVTEVHEAQASYDISIADEASAISGLEMGRRELERITGVYSERVCRLLADRIELKVPEPLDPEAWIDMARQSNQRLLAYRKEVDIAKREVDKNRASRYPTVDFWAGRNYSMSETNYTIGSIYDTWSISLQVSVPVYSGGYTSALIRQASARKLKAFDDMTVEERAMVSDVRKYYNAKLNSIAQVKAYGQAVISGEVALEGTKRAFLAGFRTNADVLDAQKKLFDSRRSLAKARYQYFLNGLMLKNIAGVLGAADLDMIDHCLDASE